MPDLSIALTPVLAARLARIALAGIIRAYPHSPAHVLRDADEVRRPRALHPACYGCVDLHSAVHSHWLLVRLLRVLPDLPEAATIRATLDAHLSPANLQVEAASFAAPGRRSFARPYGWAWLLTLAEARWGWDDPDGRRWSAALAPLAALIVTLYREYIPRLTYPIRSGVHRSTAFGLTFALDYVMAVGDEALRTRARAVGCHRQPLAASMG